MALAVLIIAFIVIVPIIALVRLMNLGKAVSELELQNMALRSQLARLEKRLTDFSNAGPDGMTSRSEADPTDVRESTSEPAPLTPARTVAATSSDTAERVSAADETSAELRDAQAPDQTAQGTLPPAVDSQDRAAPPPAPPPAYVFRPETRAALVSWLSENWVLAIGAVSLCLAGVFMVQYSIETGLLSPVVRVLGALALGVALIAAAEVIRRRFGDEGSSSTAAIPSVLAGSGLVSMFVGVLSAHGLYGLISPELALGGLFLISVLAVVLGWFYGPVLAATGLVSATAAPFLVGGESDSPWIFYYYFAFIALAGLAVDTLRRWAWVTVAVLIATGIAAWLIYLGGAGGAHFLTYWIITGLGAVILPVQRWIPDHSGTGVIAMLTGVRPFPEFPTRVVMGVLVAMTGSVGCVALWADGLGLALGGVGVLALLLLASLQWLGRAPALQESAAVPAIGILGWAALEGIGRGPVARGLAITGLGDLPLVLLLLAGLAAGAAGLGFVNLRAAVVAGHERTGLVWSVGLAGFAAGLILIVEFLWQPAQHVSPYSWALTVIAVAAFLTLLAERSHQALPGPDRSLRAGVFAVAALTLITLAMFILLTKAALTLALGVMTLGAVWLDRRTDVPLLGGFAQLGVALITYRGLVDPGLYWATETASLIDLGLAYLAPAALFVLGWIMLRHTDRPRTAAVLESGAWLIGAVLAALLLLRIFGKGQINSHWGMGLLATIALASCAAQIYRLREDDGQFTKILRLGLLALFALTATGYLVLQATVHNPLFSRLSSVIGPPVLDSLALGFLPVALILAVMAWRLDRLTGLAQSIVAGLAALYVAFYVGLEIRRLWHGPDLSVPVVHQPELYSYTVALLVASVAMLFVAFSKRSVAVRRLALAGVGLTIAKVFLVDMSGLTGLLRVASFLGLGLSLAALAWLNRVMQRQWDQG